jgi:hypothetical protein
MLTMARNQINIADGGFMHGYDTLVGAWPQTEVSHPSSYISSHPWDMVPWQTDTVDAVTGKRKKTLNVEGAQFTYIYDLHKKLNEYRVQCSLPKLLYKTNTKTLPPEDAFSALDLLDPLVQQYFPGAPPVAGMIPRRLDATADRDLGDELAVSAALIRMQHLEYLGRRPWIGDKGTVNWSGKSGAHRNRVYGKFIESGEDTGRGVLRVEREAKGLKSVRADYAKALAVAVSAGDLTIGEALAVPSLAKTIVGPLETLVDSALKELEDMTIGEVFTRALAAGFPPVKAAKMVGYVNVIQHFGGYHNTMLTRQGQWLLKKDFEKIGVNPHEVELTPLYVRLIGPPNDLGEEGRAERMRMQQEEDDRMLIEAAKEAKKRIKRRAREAAAGEVGREA